MKTSFRIVAAASLSSLALVAATGISASAEANPSNHGHHYGQLKHPKVAPPPAPAPAPVPTPHPITQPTPAVVPLIHTTHTGNVSDVPVRDTTATPVSGVPDATMPVAPAVELNDAAGPFGQYDWLILLVLPSLLAVWLIAFVGLARRFSPARKKVRQVQAAPTPA